MIIIDHRYIKFKVNMLSLNPYFYINKRLNMCDCYYGEIICPECGEIVDAEEFVEHLKKHYQPEKDTKKEVELIEVKVA